MNTGNSTRISPHLSCIVRKGHILSLAFLLLSIILPAQSIVEWDKAYGGNMNEELTALQQTDDGGYILGGLTVSGISGDVTEVSPGGSDYWMLKVDALGNVQWDKRFGGNSFEFSQTLIQTSDGGYLIGGWSPSGISGDKTEALRGFWGTDYWLVKTDASGNKIWDRTFGGSTNDQLWEVRETHDGGYILVGLSDSPNDNDKTEASKGGFDFWVIKINSAGTKVWDRTIGGTGTDMAFSVRQTPDRGFIIGGLSDSPVSGDKSEPSQGSIDFWVVKLDSMGVKQWDRTFGGAGNDQLLSIETTLDNGYILGGWSQSDIGGHKTESNRGGSDFWIIKTDSNGNLQWDKTIGGDDKDELRSISQNSKGTYVLGGYSASGISGDKTQASQGMDDYWIVFVSATGQLLYEQSFGGSGADVMYAMTPTTDNSYLLGGISSSTDDGDRSDPTLGGNDQWVIKLLCDPSITLANDTSVCQGSPVVLDAINNSPFACAFLWSDGSTDAIRTVIPMDTTTYSVTITDIHGCTASDERTINTLPLPLVDLGNDTSFCQGQSIMLDAGNAGANFVWSTAETSQTIVVTSSGNYSVTVTDANGCSAVDDIDVTVHPLPVVALGNDTAFCSGGVMTLDAGNTGASFVWSTTETSQTIVVTSSGNYSVSVTDANGCSAVDDIDVTVHPLPVVALGNDTAFC
ncbi:MAG: hypothetical protein AAGG75_16510, partial [Bacteroidota bacterium]